MTKAEEIQRRERIAALLLELRDEYHELVLDAPRYSGSEAGVPRVLDDEATANFANLAELRDEVARDLHPAGRGLAA